MVWREGSLHTRITTRFSAKADGAIDAGDSD